MNKLMTIQAIVYHIYKMGSYAYLAKDAIEHYDDCVARGEEYRAELVFAIADKSCSISGHYEQTANALTLLLLATPPSRPTSAPAAIRGASVAVEVADLPAPTNTNDDAKNPPVIEIKRFIGGNFQAVTINDELTLVPTTGAIAKALPSKPTVIDCSDPYEEAATQRRAEHRQRRIWQDYDSGKNTAEDFAPQLPPVVQVVSEQKPYQFHGGYYGSFGYYSRNM